MSNLQSCPACRALIDSTESLCPYCGASTERRRVREVNLSSTETPGMVTGWLIGICVVFFVIEMVATLGAFGAEGLWKALMGVPGPILGAMGARSTPHILAGEWWRLIMPIFLHGSFLHLLFNSMAMIQAGPLVEQAYGRPRFVIIFILSGALGFALGAYTSPMNISIGASGSLFGLIGAAGLYGHRRGDAMGRMIRSSMIQWGLYALLFGLLIRADNAAHIGGLVSGIGLAYLLGDRNGRGDERLWTALAWVAVVVTLAAMGLGVASYLGSAGR